MHQEDPLKCAHLSHPSSFFFLFSFMLFFHLALLSLVVISNCDLAPTCCHPAREHHPYFQSDASLSRQLAQLAAESVSLLLLRKAACPASGSCSFSNSATARTSCLLVSCFCCEGTWQESRSSIPSDFDDCLYLPLFLHNMLFLHCPACSLSCTRVLMSRDFYFEVQRLFLHTHHMVCASWTTLFVSLICVFHFWLTCSCQCCSLVCACTLLLSSTFGFSISKFSTFVSSSCPNMHKWSNGFQPPIVSGSNERHLVVKTFPMALSVWAVLQPPQTMCIYLLEPKLFVVASWSQQE